MNKTYDVVHTIKLITKFNLDNPSTAMVVNMKQEQVEEMCRGAFIKLANELGWLDKINKNGGSFALVQFAEDGE